jgi:hypothetical protein
MSEADTENGNFVGEVTDEINADAGILGRARARRDYDAVRLHFFHVSNRDLIVATNLDGRAEFSEILNQVVGKGIVVVENEDHSPPFW